MMKIRLFALIAMLMSVCALALHAQKGNIEFADTLVRDICVSNWDKDGDGNLSYEEAASVTEWNTAFRFNKYIISFDELQYFTGLTHLAPGAFSDCYGINRITLPPNIETIDEKAFWSCINISHITLPQSLRRLENACFYHCERMVDLTVPGGVDSISDQAFMWCQWVQKATLEEGVSYLGEYSFHMCRSLEEVTLPSTVKSIGYMAFWGSDAIKIINCKAQVPPKAGSYFFEKRVLMEAMLFVPPGCVDAYRAAPGWKDFTFISELF